MHPFMANSRKSDGPNLSPEEARRLADEQRMRAASAGSPIRAGEVAGVAGKSFGCLLLMVLMIASLILTVFVPPLGLIAILLTLILGLVAR